MVLGAKGLPYSPSGTPRTHCKWLPSTPALPFLPPLFMVLLPHLPSAPALFQYLPLNWSCTTLQFSRHGGKALHVRQCGPAQRSGSGGERRLQAHPHPPRITLLPHLERLQYRHLMYSPLAGLQCSFQAAQYQHCLSISPALTVLAYRQHQRCFTPCTTEAQAVHLYHPHYANSNKITS